MLCDTPLAVDVCSGPVSRRWFDVLASIVLLFLVMGALSVFASGQAANQASEIEDIGPVVHALCGKQVALLGEPPMHGFGKTLKFKVELVRRLVDECHYSALIVESGSYDYINMDKKLRSGQNVTDSAISAAIGGIWANKEVQSIIPFLREKMEAGSLTLGGLDDQIGRGTYAQREMASDLVQYLEGDKRSRCLAILQRHMLWQYTEGTPYSPSDKIKIVGCLDEIESRIAKREASKEPWVEGDKAMIDGLKRNLARNFTEDDFTKRDQEMKWWNDRDRSMYLNFQWLLSRLPKNSKVIVWAATVHVAKDLSGIDGFEGKVPLGSYIRREFGDRASILGFSAYSGSYAMVHQPVRQLNPAPDNSLEGQVFAHRDVDNVYLSHKQLRKSGAIPARPLGPGFNVAHWDKVFDGLVLFHEERPPEYLPR
jgi:erythromycin esterase-like protein